MLSISTQCFENTTEAPTVPPSTTRLTKSKRSSELPLPLPPDRPFDPLQADKMCKQSSQQVAAYTHIYTRVNMHVPTHAYIHIHIYILTYVCVHMADAVARLLLLLLCRFWMHKTVGRKCRVICDEGKRKAIKEGQIEGERAAVCEAHQNQKYMCVCVCVKVRV